MSVKWILRHRACVGLSLLPSAIIFAAVALVATGCLPSSTTSSSTTATTEDELGLRAASPACTSARAACRAQVQPVIDQIQAACAGVAGACVPGHLVHGDAATLSPDAGGSCADARAACAAAIAEAKPTLQQIGQDCDAQITMACMGHHVASDGGTSTTGGGGEIDAAGGGAADAAANACLGAVQACHTQLGDIRAMPPAECATSQMVCGGGGFLTNADACRTAAAACQAALQSTLQSTLQDCGASISAACRHHAG